MNVALFKSQIKQIVKANPQPMKFTILGMGSKEIYNSKIYTFQSDGQY